MYLSPRDRTLRWSRGLGLAGVFLAGMLLLGAVDHGLWRLLKTDESIATRDWYHVLRDAGYLPTWIVVAAAIIAASGRTAGSAWPRALLLPAAAAASGLLAEICKLVLARERPMADGLHHYRGLFAGFADGSNLGLPSSHAAVAFGAAFAGMRLYRGSGWILLPLAAGCGLTRVLMGDHFASDVWAAAWVGLAGARVCIPVTMQRRRGPGATRLTA